MARRRRRAMGSRERAERRSPRQGRRRAQLSLRRHGREHEELRRLQLADLRRAGQHRLRPAGHLRRQRLSRRAPGPRVRDGVRSDLRAGPAALGKRISEFSFDADGNLLTGPVPLIEYIGAGRATCTALAAGPDGLYFADLYKDFGAVTPVDAGANVFRIRYVGVADFSASAPSGPAPATVSFQDLSAVPGASAWHWDFGDGASSDERNPVHQYPFAGSYDVRLTVTGPSGPVARQKAAEVVVPGSPRSRSAVRPASRPPPGSSGRSEAPARGDGRRIKWADERSRRERREGTRPGWPWVVGILVLAVVVLVAAMSRPKAPSVQTAAVRRSNLQVPVQCDGTLEPPPGGELRAAEAAAIAELFVQNGARVRAGTPLLRLENTDLSQKALDARSEALRLEGERTSTASDLADFEQQEKHAARVFEGDSRLLSSGAITKMTYESDELALSQARDRSRAARARLSALDGAEKGAPSRLELARQSAADLERRTAALTVKAPADGLVYGLPRRVGETIAAGAGRRERDRSRASPAAREGGSAGSAPDRRRPAPGRRLRRPARPEVGRPGHLRGSGVARGRRPRGRRGPR